MDKESPEQWAQLIENSFVDAIRCINCDSGTQMESADSRRIQAELARIKRKADAFDELQSTLDTTASEHAAGVRLAIEDSARIKRERDEAMGFIQNLVDETTHHETACCDVIGKCEAFLSRIGAAQ